MKKLFAIILTLVLTLSLAACGNKEEAYNETEEDVKEKVTEAINNENIESTIGEDKQNNQPEEITVTKDEPVTEKNEKTTASLQTTKGDVQNTVTTKPATTKPATTKPAATKPATTKPAATKPAVTVAPTTEAEKNNVFFNANNNIVQKNCISIRPRYVYWENGYLVAECFVINGYDYAVSQINVKNLSFSNSRGLIASAGFGTIGNVTLQPNAHVVWTFKFAPNTISQTNADLSSLTSNVQCSYVY